MYLHDICIYFYGRVVVSEKDIETNCFVFRTQNRRKTFLDNGHVATEVFFGILKQHFREYRKPRLLTDYCQICNDFDEKVLKKMAKLLEATRAELVAHLPSYFTAWDKHAADKDYAAKPALHIHDIQHYIRRHSEAGPCAMHQNDSFPCGCAAARRSCRDRVSLHDVECNRLLDLRAMDRLVATYNFHRASNEHQKPAIDAMLRMPALGRLSIIADWAELMTLPLLPKATDTSFYGTARKELAVFGCCLVEHADSSTADRPVLRKGFLLLVSDILDHTSCRTTTLLQKAVSARLSRRKLDGIDFISDCAGHFRSYETMYWALVEQVKSQDCEIAWHWGVEKHLKHDCDRLFGWWRQGPRSVLENQISITDMEALKTVMQSHFDKARVKDCTSPLIKIVIDNSTPTPAKIFKLETSSDFRISRTYCVSAVANKYSALGVSIFNHIYSTRPTSVRVHVSSVEELPGPTSWRRGYYGRGAEQWQTDPQPLPPGESSHLSKRMDAQCDRLPHHRDRLHGRYDFQKALATVRRQQRRRKQRKRMNADRSSSSDSSTDSDGTSSTESM